MGWYSHPDTLASSYAEGVAKKAGERFTIAHKRAYRNAYEKFVGEGDAELPEYLASLDKSIAQHERLSNMTIAELLGELRRQFMASDTSGAFKRDFSEFIVVYDELECRLRKNGS